MKFADYQNRLVGYIEMLEENGKDSVEFFNSLMYVEGEDYGDYQCDICSHPLKYAMVIKSSYLVGIGIFAHPDNDVYIGSTCFDKLTRLSWLRKSFNKNYKEWRKCIKLLKEGNKSEAGKILLTVKEAKEKIKEMRNIERKVLADKNKSMRKTIHSRLLEHNEDYYYLFHKLGRVIMENDSAYVNMHITPYSVIDTDNDFLSDLYEKIQTQKSGLSDKQMYWFKKLTVQIKGTNTIEHKRREMVCKDYKEKLYLLSEKARLGNYDADFVKSLYEQIKRKTLSDKQIKAVEKICYKYREQLKSLEDEN